MFRFPPAVPQTPHSVMVNVINSCLFVSISWFVCVTTVGDKRIKKRTDFDQI